MFMTSYIDRQLNPPFKIARWGPRLVLVALFGASPPGPAGDQLVVKFKFTVKTQVARRLRKNAAIGKKKEDRSKSRLNFSPI